MKPVPTPRTNVTIRAAEGSGAVDLPLYADSVGLESVWEPTEKDLAVLRDAKRVGVRLRVVGHQHPGVAVDLVPLDGPAIVRATDAVARAEVAKFAAPGRPTGGH